MSHGCPSLIQQDIGSTRRLGDEADGIETGTRGGEGRGGEGRGGEGRRGEGRGGEGRGGEGRRGEGRGGEGRDYTLHKKLPYTKTHTHTHTHTHTPLPPHPLRDSTGDSSAISTSSPMMSSFIRSSRPPGEEPTWPSAHTTAFVFRMSSEVKGSLRNASANFFTWPCAKVVHRTESS